jgi:hypothetical protein
MRELHCVADRAGQQRSDFPTGMWRIFPPYTSEKIYLHVKKFFLHAAVRWVNYNYLHAVGCYARISPAYFLK